MSYRTAAKTMVTGVIGINVSIEIKAMIAMDIVAIGMGIDKRFSPFQCSRPTFLAAITRYATPLRHLHWGCCC
jgi:hypothetical protein